MSDFKKFCIDEKLSSVQIVGARKAWQHQQAKIEKLEIELSTTKQVLGNVIDMEVAKVDNLKAQLNNMEACYIEKKKQVEELQGRIDAALEIVNKFCEKRYPFNVFCGEMLDALRGAND